MTQYDLEADEETPSPILDLYIPCGTIFWVSVSVENTSEGAILRFGGPDHLAMVGVELGSTRYQAPFDIGEIEFTPGASGGALTVWFDAEIDCGRC